MTAVAAAGPGLPGRLRVLVALEMIAGLAFSWILFAIYRLFGWPRHNDNVAGDLLLMLAPALLAIGSGVFAHRCWRAGRRRLAWALMVLAGLPLFSGFLLWLGNWA